MTYGTGTLNSASPARDMMAALQAPIQAAGLTLVDSYASPAPATWKAVAYGNGVFVAIAQSVASVATSADGVTWIKRALPASQVWSGVAYGAGLFVIVGTGPMVMTSPDGITWTQRIMPQNTGWTAVGYGGGQFVATCTTTYVATSPDGISWTQRSVPTAVTSTGVAYGAGMWVIVSTGANALTSGDGISWTLRTMPTSGYVGIAYGGGNFAAVTSAALASSSPDGLTWTNRNMVVSGWAGVTFGGGQFLAVAPSNTTIAISADGTAWTNRTNAMPSSAAWQAVAYGGGTYAAITTGQSIAASSTDGGTTFTTRSMPGTSASPAADVYKSAAAGNVFGADWYLILRRASDTSGLFFQVAESYNPATHQVSNMGGSGQAVAPTAVTYTNPQVTDADYAIASSAQIALTAGTAFPYWYSITRDRIIVGARTPAGVEAGFYAGLYEDLLPAGTTQFPLVCARFPTSIAVGSAIGGGTGGFTGGFTREPLQAAAVAQNFEAAIHNGFMVGPNNGSQASSLTPMTSPAALYGNVGSPSRILVGSSRAAYTADATRGLLIGCVAVSLLSAIGDSIVTGGRTYTRFGGPSTSYGYFVDQGL